MNHQPLQELWHSTFGAMLIISFLHDQDNKMVDNDFQEANQYLEN